MSDADMTKDQILDDESVGTGEKIAVLEEGDTGEHGSFAPAGFAAKFAKKVSQAVDAVADTAQKTVETLKDGQAIDAAKEQALSVRDRAGDLVQNGVNATAEAIKQGKDDFQRWQLGPITAEELYSEDFVLPELIAIVDGNQYRNIPACEGAVALLNPRKGIQILQLFKDEVDSGRTGLMFYHGAVADTVYIADPYSDTRYIKLEEYVRVMQQDVFTELKDLARILGAKRCVLESVERDSSSIREEARLSGNARGLASKKRVGADFSRDSSLSSTHERRICFEQTYEGSAEPERPTLVRLAGDFEIEKLVESRCDTDNRMVAKSYTTTIESQSTMCMNEKLASKIDAAAKGIGLGLSSSFAKQVERQMHSRFYYTIDF